MAYDFVKDRRHCIQPNRGFLRQLGDWEKSVLGHKETDPDDLWFQQQQCAILGKFVLYLGDPWKKYVSSIHFQDGLLAAKLAFINWNGVCI